ncbi:SgcJ/EcaC family oxidoreductase [Brevibacterium luteolum]|uniref:SgcJ/EcaC family oxidoreductase n=1 Tax=Brevibacterium luteolum TaxID=199591 RepID=A0A6G8KVS4_9MICO|nr:SgcJ/EcaC family oxidoreductase [Brevibacterium luteolum]QIN28899.1 SgcJ/EcaC family oxidoreductase [Brevibacterium luteolum]
MEQPEDVVGRWEAAWNSADAEALASLFADDADFVNVVGLWWHNRTRIREAHAYGFATIFPGSTIVVGPPRVRMLGERGATVHSRWKLRGQVSPSGDSADEREGIFIFVLENREYGWITVAAQNTDVVPSAETLISMGGSRESISYRRTQ